MQRLSFFTISAIVFLGVCSLPGAVDATEKFYVSVRGGKTWFKSRNHLDPWEGENSTIYQSMVSYDVLSIDVRHTENDDVIATVTPEVPVRLEYIEEKRVYGLMDSSMQDDRTKFSRHSVTLVVPSPNRLLRTWGHCAWLLGVAGLTTYWLSENENCNDDMARRCMVGTACAAIGIGLATTRYHEDARVEMVTLRNNEGWVAEISEHILRRISRSLHERLIGELQILRWAANTAVPLLTRSNSAPAGRLRGPLM